MANRFWVRGTINTGISTVGAEVRQLLPGLHNNNTDRDTWTIVRGFYSLATDSTVATLAVWTLFVVNENLAAADFSDAIPAPGDPTVFLWMPGTSESKLDIRAKRDINYKEHVVSRLDITKSVATEIAVTYQMLIVAH